jgi:hypothetical protein
MGKDLPGSGRGLFEVLSLHLLGGNEETHIKLRIASVQAGIRTKHLLNTSQERYR